VLTTAGLQLLDRGHRAQRLENRRPGLGREREVAVRGLVLRRSRHELEALDVDLVASEDRADLAEHAGLVLVARDEQDPARREVEAQVVDRDDARLAPEDGSRDAVRAPTRPLRSAHADLAAAEVGALLMLSSTRMPRSAPACALTKFIALSVWRSTPTRKARRRCSMPWRVISPPTVSSTLRI
jgi:hypothetical protein